MVAAIPAGVAQADVESLAEQIKTKWPSGFFLNANPEETRKRMAIAKLVTGNKELELRAIFEDAFKKAVFPCLMPDKKKTSISKEELKGRRNIFCIAPDGSKVVMVTKRWFSFMEPYFTYQKGGKTVYVEMNPLSDVHVVNPCNFDEVFQGVEGVDYEAAGFVKNGNTYLSKEHLRFLGDYWSNYFDLEKNQNYHTKQKLLPLARVQFLPEMLFWRLAEYSTFNWRYG